MTVDYKLERIKKESVVEYFKVLYYHFLGKNEEDHGYLRITGLRTRLEHSTC
jgi:hypothetical protein